MAGSSWMKASFPQALLGGRPRVTLHGRGTSGRRGCWEGRGRETACGTPRPTLAHRRAHPRLPGGPEQRLGPSTRMKLRDRAPRCQLCLNNSPGRQASICRGSMLGQKCGKAVEDVRASPHGVPCAKEPSPGDPHGSS